jgi:hypothetical protein
MGNNVAVQAIKYMKMVQKKDSVASNCTEMEKKKNKMNFFTDN